MSPPRQAGRAHCLTWVGLILALLLTLGPGAAFADEASTAAQFAALRGYPLLLRQFMAKFPKGGDLHNHLDGSVYAERIIGWAAADGRCVLLATAQISAAPCDPSAGRPAMASVVGESSTYARLIDSYSMRNYSRGAKSAHDQFFDSFGLFIPGTSGHEGAMIAEAARRRGVENTEYLELMQSFGMADAVALAARQPGKFSAKSAAAALATDAALAGIAVRTAENLTRYEKDWRSQARCGTSLADPGCGVTVRYLAQVLRALPPEAVYAQIVLAFLLVDRDPRYVGINLVEPEDDPATLANYDAQMTEIRALSSVFPKVHITLHAGELNLGLVPPEDTRDHIRKAVMIAGAQRIGHGISIGLEDDALDLLRYMSQHRVLVEINLSSNEAINGIAGLDHPFMLYREYGVPTALSADDEGVLRIDLVHEYVRAAQTYPLSYQDFKELSRNALAYAFVAGQPLLTDLRSGALAASCTGHVPMDQEPAACRQLLRDSLKARLQWDLERRFEKFETLDWGV